MAASAAARSSAVTAGGQSSSATAADAPWRATGAAARSALAPKNAASWPNAGGRGLSRSARWAPATQAPSQRSLEGSGTPRRYSQNARPRARMPRTQGIKTEGRSATGLDREMARPLQAAPLRGGCPAASSTPCTARTAPASGRQKTLVFIWPYRPENRHFSASLRASFVSSKWKHGRSGQ